MEIRDIELEGHEERLHQIWREVGWAEVGSTRHIEIMAEHVPGNLGIINGEVEGAIFSAPGSMRYLDEEVPFHAMATMGIGFPARRQGMASSLFLNRVAENAEDGAAVTGLSMFDQGFYDRFGFNALSHERRYWIDPQSLDLDVRPDPPERLDYGDWRDLARCKDRRRLLHGGIRVNVPEFTRAEMEWGEDNFGLGYRNGSGELTHCLWLSIPGDTVRGPYAVQWMDWRNRDQLYELLGLVKNLGDQINLIKITEPPGINLQTLLDRPFRNMQLTEGGEYENTIETSAYQQFRILDVEQALAHTSISGREPVRFNLELSDPCADMLDPDRPWDGCEDTYLVEVGEESSAVRGERDPSLPTAAADVADFSRLWLGAQSATGLFLEQRLNAPEGLRRKLDRVFDLPDPRPDWLF